MNPTQLPTVPIRIDRGLSGIVTTSLTGAPLRAIPDEAAWGDLLRRLVHDPRSMPDYQVLKARRAGTARRLVYGQDEVYRATLQFTSGDADCRLQVVCKKTAASGPLKALADRFRLSHARKNFERGLRLKNAGIETPLPLAAVDRTDRATSWLVTEYLPELVDLDRIALAELPRLGGAALQNAKRALIEAVADLLTRLHHSGLHHRDLKASNILIDGWRREDAALRTVLVDLDGLGRAGRRPTLRWKRLIRLAASLVGYSSLTRGDFARCLRMYLTRTDGDDARWRPRFRRLAREASRYARRARARKSHKLDGYS